MAESVVLVDRPAPHVARLLINRPAKRNAIDHAVRTGLMEELTKVLDDATIRAVVFGGVGGVFSAGGDLPSMLDLDEEQARERMRHIHALCRLVANARIPVVSAIEGIGAGGAIGLALLGDRIIVGEGTTILFPFLGLGLTPDWGQLLTLPRRVGLSAAFRLLTSGTPVTGPEALRLQLADTLAADSDVMGTAVAQAAALALLPREAMARMTARLKKPSGSLEEELEREENDQAVCLRSAEFAEGYGAFIAKRPPDFTGV
ncbi:enoyl-CoA hydratase/isomerase family protein [Magnetospirillum sp. 15-1]|uniref:enoyl-CoA hydratase/isomerase family protein n=1 Tax=Magnetospirillum sp. 15-1 TaxID=1979370 RepID=UPI000BBCAC82|nr:enoyl-CoA hydratase/isomerase family protein [Magnetospirillum sp. 15-1]